MPLIRGSFRVFILYDVAEEIDLTAVRNVLGLTAKRQPAFKEATPEYVRFERPPVTDRVQIKLGNELVDGQIKFFDYGVLSVALEMKVAGDWPEVIQMSSRWMNSAELERCAGEAARAHAERLKPALRTPYTEWVSEDYYVLHVVDVHVEPGRALTGANFLSEYGTYVADIVRGEARPLSDQERREVLQPSISYYPEDLLVVGWSAAVVYDTPEGAEPTIQLLEYANTQLLEFRHYDALLSRVLSEVYKTIQPRVTFFGRWGLARKANRLNAIRLDITELAERVDTAIKFLSDMYSARAYKLAADKVGVSDYRKLVEEKLRTAGELYDFMINEFHQARAFVLEVMVVAILVIELVMLFAGKPM